MSDDIFEYIDLNRNFCCCNEIFSEICMHWFGIKTPYYSLKMFLIIGFEIHMYRDFRDA